MTFDLPKLSVAALALSAVCSIVAWTNFSAAANGAAEAHRIQAQEAPQGGGEPPDLEEYRAILDTLDESLEIRTQIDDLLGQIESSIARIEGRQDDAISLVSSALEEVEAITLSLGSSAESASISDRALTSLRDKLATSASLARAIAEELEELDRSMGPSIGDGP